MREGALRSGENDPGIPVGAHGAHKVNQTIPGLNVWRPHL